MNIIENIIKDNSFEKNLTIDDLRMILIREKLLNREFGDYSSEKEYDKWTVDIDRQEQGVCLQNEIDDKYLWIKCCSNIFSFKDIKG